MSYYYCVLSEQMYNICSNLTQYEMNATKALVFVLIKRKVNLLTKLLYDIEKMYLPFLHRQSVLPDC